MTLPSIMFAYLRIGEPSWARHLVEHASLYLAGTGDAAVLDAIALAHSDHVTEARRVLGPVLTEDCVCAARTNLTTAWLLEATLADRSELPGRTHLALSRALRLAEPDAVVRPFYDQPRCFELLFDHRGRFGAVNTFADTIWTSVPRTSTRLSEPLTRRERDLLSELPTLRTAQEIAADLCVSVNTVKSHLRGIYRKLGVTSRREAVDAAHHLGLI